MCLYSCLSYSAGKLLFIPRSIILFSVGCLTTEKELYIYEAISIKYYVCVCMCVVCVCVWCVCVCV